MTATNPEPAAGGDAAKKQCFVVMGFGLKTDFATGRTLDLNKSYRLLIKPVVEGAGLNCVRADEIFHSGAIDVPMYRELLGADVVVADLSTANPNALYELGVRHALRPRTTIVISESKLVYPFDLNHIAITRYTHLGDAIDYDEVVRFQKVLGDMIRAVLANPATDSPVYTFLTDLSPPVETAAPKLEGLQGGSNQTIATASFSASDKAKTAAKIPNATLSVLVQQGEQAIDENRFADAKAFFSAARSAGDTETGEDGAITRDPYLIQRLVLAAYMSKQPTELAALNEALELLQPLSPETSNDPETVGLAGAIEKRLFNAGQGDEHLKKAVRYYERGYLLRNDFYNGINLAYLLNLRANSDLDPNDAERLADMVWASRIRKEVVVLCAQELKKIDEHADKSMDKKLDKLASEILSRERERKFWCLATKAEANFGLGAFDEYKLARNAAIVASHANWMVETMDRQIEKLGTLLASRGNLLDPPWRPLDEDLTKG